MNDHMGTRLKRAREKRGYKSARKAAAAIGVVYSTYSGHERYGLIPRKELIRYARFFAVSVDWLLYGKGGEAPIKPHKISQLIVPLKQIPLYALKELMIFAQIRDNVLPAEPVEYIAMPKDTPHTAFAVSITDKSMVQRIVPSLKPGDIAITDPASEPQPGDLVMAIVKGFQEALVRRFGRTIQDGVTYIVLTPSNISFETITFVPDKDNYILGRVRSAIIDF
jgi:SOS-response transcriptional repressor LexA